LPFAGGAFSAPAATGTNKIEKDVPALPAGNDIEEPDASLEPAIRAALTFMEPGASLNASGLLATSPYRQSSGGLGASLRAE
jgi:hypothetical protein